MLVYSSVHLSATDINQISTQSQSKKGKVKLLYWSLGGVLISLKGHEPVGGNTTIVCDAWPDDARPTVTFPATRHHRPLAGTKLYCLVTEAHVCKQLVQGCTR